MLVRYLEDGQPDFTDYLVHGLSTSKKARKKKLRKTVRLMERKIMPEDRESRAAQDGSLCVTGASEQVVEARLEDQERASFNRE
jgi:hypothetical protein